MPLLNTLARLWRFNGGLHLPGHKHESTARPIELARWPHELVLPLAQHLGAAAKPVVAIGQRVNKGELLAQPEGHVSAALHAPTSGSVAAIEPRPSAHPSGIPTPAIVLEADGRDAWTERLPAPIEDSLKLDPAYLRQRVREAGIVGLGGAAFPSAVKLDPRGAIRLLVLNAAECEPYISCDEMLMRERARAVVGGLLIMRRALGANDCIIGIEDSKPEAFAALSEALAQFGDDAEDVLLQQVPALYPSGGSKQLIRLLTGIEIPRSGHATDAGILCHNVGTAAAVHDAIVEGRPLISRIVTVTGAGVAAPRNFEALIGTPVDALVEQAGGYTDRAERLIIGGPMMGLAIPHGGVPVTKGMQCVLVASRAELAPPEPAMPCIRCGECVSVCPVDLLPQQLYWHARAREFDRAQALHLFDCIECGCCAAVCPSHLPLVQYYRYAKTEVRATERSQQAAEQARSRHQFRLMRLERDKEARAAKLRQRKETLAAEAAASGAPEDPKKAAIAAALARVQAKKAAQQAAAAGKADEPAD